MGLRLRTLQVTTDIGRIFCPKCGNGGTLHKVAATANKNGVVLAGRRPRVSLHGTKASIAHMLVTVIANENGVVLAGLRRRRRISLRGTKLSLPLPQGGRDAVTKNPILREDQLPQKFLHLKKKEEKKMMTSWCQMMSSAITQIRKVFSNLR